MAETKTTKAITYKDIQKVNSEIKTIDVKGKQYAEVPQRVTAFRKLYPQGTITTEVISIENGVCVMKASVSVDGVILGEGTAYEKEGSSFINKTSFIENCETSAVGRALGFAGFGSDGSIASAEEVMNAQKQQYKMNEDELRKELKDLLETTGSDVPKFLEWATEKYERKIASVDEMLDLELKDAIKTIKKSKKGDK